MTSFEHIQARLQQLRQAYRGWLLLVTAVTLCALFLWGSLLFIVGDLTWRLPAAACWTAWALLLTSLLLLGGWASRVLTRRMSLEQMCSRVEQVLPRVRNRLINAVQFAQSEREEERAFAQRLLAEDEIDVSGVSGWKLFPRRYLKWAAMAALLGLLASALVAVLNPAGYQLAMQRLLLPMRGLAPYSLTHIVAVAPGEMTVSRGERLEVSVQFAGEIPARPLLMLQGVSGEQKQLLLESVDASIGLFAVHTPPLFETVRYWVVGGDARSPRYTVQVQSPPSLVTWQLEARPPAYTGLPMRRLQADAPDAAIPAGSELLLTIQASQPLARASIRQGRQEIGSADAPTGAEAQLLVQLTTLEPMHLILLSTVGLDARVPLPIAILPDLGPSVSFRVDATRIMAAPTEKLALPYLAQDEYGVAQVALMLVEQNAEDKQLALHEIEALHEQQAEGRFTVDLAELGARPGSRLRFRLLARDHGPDSVARQGRSQLLDIIVPLPEEARRETESARQATGLSVNRLIQLQRANLKASRELQTQRAAGAPAVPATTARLLTEQVEIRRLTGELLGNEAVLGDLVTRLRSLEATEMREAVEALAALTRAAESEWQEPLTGAISLQGKILAQLIGLPEALTHEQAYQDKADLLAQLQKLVARQRQLLADTRAAMQADAQGDAVAALVNRQESLADQSVLFLEAVKRLAEAGSDDDFARQLSLVHVLLTSGNLYEKMLSAADALSQLDWATGIQAEDEALRLLAEALKMMNTWRVEKARESIAEASRTLRDIAEQLGDMEKRQNEIVEVTKDLTRRGELNDEIREELGKLDEEQKEWLQKLEKMAQDLYQFPELPVSNELNAKMREVYEDVEQAADSANAPAVLIAVQKEDGLLEAIKNTKERVEDVEMWLPDVPDNIKWDLETFDAAEFPDMPLVDLPEELEDIVGDLLDQSAEIDAESQDSTGNQMMADAEMGWGVADGPMPNFSAKGKSGNTKPNDNEMTGRSGAGREGQATGELIENVVKGLEGRETHARKTNDPLQTGQVEEAEDSTLEARATGGGKLGGESETIGMFGDSPRRDMHMQAPASSQELRQETEATYATARLLYMNNTRPLGEAAEDMRRVERMDKEQKEFSSLQQRVLRQLQESQTELTSGAILPMTVAASQASGGSAAGRDIDLDDVDEQYRGMVSDYYKNLDY